MKIGELRHRVTVQQEMVSRDGFGGEVVTWTAVFTGWAAVEPLQGREFLDGRRLEAEVTTRIRMRYRDGVKPGMRVVWGDHTYDVEAVLEKDSRRREMILMCREWGMDQ